MAEFLVYLVQLSGLLLKLPALRLRLLVSNVALFDRRSRSTQFFAQFRLSECLLLELLLQSCGGPLVLDGAFIQLSLEIFEAVPQFGARMLFTGNLAIEIF